MHKKSLLPSLYGESSCLFSPTCVSVCKRSERVSVSLSFLLCRYACHALVSQVSVREDVSFMCVHQSIVTYLIGKAVFSISSSKEVDDLSYILHSNGCKLAA